MLHFYTYYSVGGYKDMYLGNTDMKGIERTYYLPLLPNMKLKAEKGDTAMQEKVAQLSILPKIEILSPINRYGLPKSVDKITTHGGYQMIYTHLEGDKYIIVVRDIQGAGKDENGRSIPFLISIMCDSASDLPVMNKVAAYFASNNQTIQDKLVYLLHYDAQVNGLCFELSQATDWINSLDKSPTIEIAGNRVRDIKASKGNVALLVTSSGINKDYIIKELSISTSIQEYISSDWLIPSDNPQKAEAIRESWEMVEAVKRRKIRQGIVIGAIVVGGLMLYLLCKD